MQYSGKTVLNLACFVFSSLCNFCRAESQHHLEPLSLSGIPCLVTISDTEYEWGSLEAGMCQGARHQSLPFPFPIRHFDIQKQILWPHFSVKDRLSAVPCIRDRGHFDKFPETGISDCLCAARQEDGLFVIGIEQKTDDIQSCMTQDLSYSDYVIAIRHSSSILPEPESANILEHTMFAGFLVLTVIAASRVLFDYNLLNYVVVAVYYLYLRMVYK